MTAMKAFPLTWPAGWKRTTPEQRTRAKFNQQSFGQFGVSRGSVTIVEGTKRVLKELAAFGVQEGDAIISTNLKLRLDGLPKGDQAEPTDPGVAVYWQRTGDPQQKSMAIDRYDRVADNLAAIAATLEAMRAIERHGGAMILERAFLGFTALPAPNTWRAVLEWPDEQPVNLSDVKVRYRQLAKERHPDAGGSDAQMAELNWAIQEAERELA